MKDACQSYRGFSQRPCWRAETMKRFCMKIDLISQTWRQWRHMKLYERLSGRSRGRGKRGRSPQTGGKFQDLSEKRTFGTRKLEKSKDNIRRRYWPNLTCQLTKIAKEGTVDRQCKSTWNSKRSTNADRHILHVHTIYSPWDLVSRRTVVLSS